MAHTIKMALIETILTLHRRQWSQRKIARELGIDRATVARYIHQAAQAAQPDSPSARPDSDSPPDSTYTAPATKPSGGSSGRPSACEPFREIILEKLAAGLSAQRIFQDLQAEHGYQGSYYSVRRFVARHKQAPSLPFRRLECAPAEEAQIDFGCGAPLVQSGKRRRTHVLRLVLSYSRKGYSEVVLEQTTQSFVRALENAFWSWGGVPRTLVLDNLKAAVTRADWFDPLINPRVRALALHYGVALLPTRPRTPRHKGKIERGIDYVQENALKGRTFSTLEDQNLFLKQWEQTVADARVHGTIHQLVGPLFLEKERGALLPLPTERFPFFEEGRRKVQRDGYVQVQKAYYSVPVEYVGREVWVRWDSRLIRVLNDRLQEVAIHVRREPGQFSTQPQHVPAEKVATVERGAEWLLNRVRLLGKAALAWSEAVLEHRGVEGLRVLQGLLSLAETVSASTLDRVCARALEVGDFHLQTIRDLCAQQQSSPERKAFCEEHPLIRPLTECAQQVQDCFEREEEG